MSSSSSSSKRVLIVEDERAARDASEHYLINHGFEVRAAANEEDALREAADFKPNILVCDWNLGEHSSGTDVARFIQQKQDIPVIFVTAHPLARLRDVTRDLRVARYLRKPFKLAALTNAIRRALD